MRLEPGEHLRQVTEPCPHCGGLVVDQIRVTPDPRGIRTCARCGAESATPPDVLLRALGAAMLPGMEVAS